MDNFSDDVQRTAAQKQAIVLAKNAARNYRVKAICDGLKTKMQSMNLQDAVITVYLSKDDFFNCRIGKYNEQNKRVTGFTKEKENEKPTELDKDKPKEEKKSLTFTLAGNVLVNSNMWYDTLAENKTYNFKIKQCLQIL